MPKKKVTEQMTDSIKERMKSTKPDTHLYMATSAPLLDYYLSDVLPGGFAMGKVANIVGNSHAGKSILAFTCLAEAANNPLFDEYNLIKDDCEAADEFDIEKLFGTKLLDRVQTPKTPNKTHLGSSESVEELYQNVLTWLDKDKPVIYVVDSLDSIKTREDEARAVQFQKEAKADGSYGTSKPKLMSEMLRVITSKVKRTNSFVLIISQVRDNLNAASFGKKSVRTGGRALDFYCSYILWLTHNSKTSEEVSGIKFQIGNQTDIEITKNKVTGKQRKVTLPIYYDYGIDGIAPCVDFLIKTEDIPKDTRKDNGKTIWSKKYVFNDFIGYKSEIVDHIDDRIAAYKSLLEKVSTACARIEDELAIKRKPKYD